MKKVNKKAKAKKVTRINKDAKIVILKANPRREGTGAAKRFEKMAKIGGARRTVRAAREAGYRSNDLIWDIQYGNVKLVGK